jgi:hypothetical protein
MLAVEHIQPKGLPQYARLIAAVSPRPPNGLPEGSKI